MKNSVKPLAIIYLFSFFPILHLYFRNEGFIAEGGLQVPLLYIMTVGTFMHFTLGHFNKKKVNNTIVIVILLFAFLLYGHLYYLLLDFFNTDYHSIHHRYIVPAYLLVIALISYKVMRFESMPVQVLNVLLSISIMLNLPFLMRIQGYNQSESTQKTLKMRSEPMDYPDIYYIILDSYTNAENLKKFYAYDNSPFINSLDSIGFKTLNNAKSNYPYTYFSLSSSLNMEYINYYEDTISIFKNNEDFPFKRIHNNSVTRYLKTKGYRFILLGSAYEQLNSKKYADVYIDQNIYLNSFHETLIQYSILNCLNLEFFSKNMYDQCRKTLALLPDIHLVKGPKFIFFHCLPPHPPNIFNADGSYNKNNQPSKNGYAQKKDFIAQLQFVNSSILKGIKSLLQKSNRQAIILIQGDHGTASSEEYEDEMKWPLEPQPLLLRERYHILFASHVPEKYKIKFSNTHTPVNTFRVLFNGLFNDSLPILPDDSYYARYRTPFNFRKVEIP